VAATLVAPAAGAELSLRWSQDPGHPKSAVVEVAGAAAPALDALDRAGWTPDRWASLLAVRVKPAQNTAAPAVPPMLGRYSIEDGVIRFRPQFPLDTGVTYEAVFRPAELPGARAPAPADLRASHRLDPPARPTAPTVVAAVYPSGDVLPENLLKFYLHFSNPMQRGNVYDHIRLLNDAGAAVELPFLELDEELWNPEMTRLTIFIDPGRIKRGVLPLEEIGPSLESGKTYSLVINPAWRDTSGAPLARPFRKSFRVGPPDRDPPDPARWKLTPPAAGTRDPLRVTFTGAMDHALTLRMMRVADAAGTPVEGTATMTDAEQAWSFVPDVPWPPGNHQLRVQKTIEDVAGNNIGKQFEVDLVERIEKRFKDEVVSLAFQVR
jgi:hypothetical protein